MRLRTWLLAVCWTVGSGSAAAEEWGNDWVAAPAPKAGAAVDASTATRSRPDTEEQWRRDLRSATAARRATFPLGIGLLVGGAVFYVKGASERISASNVPGCYTVTGYDVACATPEGKAEADRRLQKGKRDVTIGLVAALAGAGFAIANRSAASRRKELEKRGREKGWRLSAGSHGENVGLVYSVPYPNRKD